MSVREMSRLGNVYLKGIKICRYLISQLKKLAVKLQNFLPQKLSSLLKVLMKVRLYPSINTLL